MRRADQQVDTFRTQGKRFEDVTLAIGDYSDRSRSRAHRGRLLGPFQPAEALLLLDRCGSPGCTPAALAFQKAAVDQPQDCAILSIQSQYGVQILTSAAF